MGGLCLASTWLWGVGSAPAHPPNHPSAPRNRPEGKVLETVGVFETPKQHGKYETGQVSGAGEQSPGSRVTYRSGQCCRHCTVQCSMSLLRRQFVCHLTAAS